MLFLVFNNGQFGFVFVFSLQDYYPFFPAFAHGMKSVHVFYDGFIFYGNDNFIVAYY